MMAQMADSVLRDSWLPVTNARDIGTDAVKKNIQEHARVSEMLATALEEGMRTLKQDGIEKVLGGVTDMAQVRAVCIK